MASIRIPTARQKGLLGGWQVVATEARSKGLFERSCGHMHATEHKAIECMAKQMIRRPDVYSIIHITPYTH